MTQVRYVRSEGARLAWGELGSGPTLVTVANFATNMDSLLSVPETREWYERLSESFRVVFFDQRGTGLSERGAAGHGLDVWLHDIEAVLDAAAADEVVLFAADFSVPVALAFAAAHPERVRAAIVFGGFARLVNGDGYDVGIPEPARDATITMVTEGWGDPTSVFAHLGAPGEGPTRERDRDTVARIQRLAANPSEVEATVAALFELDVTPLLRDIQVPVLVLHRAGDQLVPTSYGRYLADAIPSADLHELPGDDHYLFFGDSERIIEEAESFVGVARAVTTSTSELGVVWFADIVSSTRSVAAAGNTAWRRRLDHYDELATYHVTQHRGHVVKHLGDGVLAVFRSARDAARCGIRFSRAAANLGFEVRVGMDAGEIEVRRDDDIAGIAVHLAQRVQAAAEPGEILTTAAVRHLLHGVDVALTERGTHTLKGFDEPVALYTITAT